MRLRAIPYSVVGLAPVVALVAGAGCSDDKAGAAAPDASTIADAVAAPPPDGATNPDGCSDACGAVDATAAADAKAEADANVWPPAGTVPMFVVSGTQGRNVVSCDDGVTWREHNVPVTTSGEFNEKGLAFGHGVFMTEMGWGAQCSFLRSEDGVTWTHLSLSDVGLPQLTECGGIVYNGDGFTMAVNGDAYASDHDGLAWKHVGTFDNGGEHVREMAGDGPSPGVVLVGGANDPSGAVKNPPHVSLDGGKTWIPTPGCSTMHAISIGQEGGGAFGGGRMVYVGYLGEVCTSSDMRTWQETKIADVTNPIAGKVNFDGTLFWASDASRQYVSSDGLAWTTRTLPTGVQLHAVARSKTGTYVGFDRGSSKFFRSADGLAWSPAAVSPPAGPDLYRIVYGYGKPSAECPL